MELDPHRPIAIAARPRTLVLSVGAGAIEAAMLGPTGAELAPRIIAALDLPRAEAAEAARAAEVLALWGVLEPLGEFDRISVIPGAGVAVDALLAELARQSQRPVRTLPAADVRWRPLITGRGVELVLVLDAGLDAALFVDGAPVPGLDLARLRARKRRTLGEALALSVATRKGPRAWGRRVRRAVDDLVAAFHPRALYLTGPGVAHLPPDLELPPAVVVVAATDPLAGALALWAPR